MKDQVRKMFAAVTMPEDTENTIRQAMASERKQKRSWVLSAGRNAAAIAAVLALVLVISPTARAAVNSWMVKYFWPDSDLTIYEVHDGEGDAVVAVVDTEAPAFARMVNGRLFFVGNHEKIDITDQITEKEPYYYTYVDDYGLTHAMAVGYSGNLENFGIYEFIWEDTDESREWVTGTGRNFLSIETETRYPWVDIVWEDLDIPWPMPE